MEGSAAAARAIDRQLVEMADIWYPRGTPSSRRWPPEIGCDFGVQQGAKRCRCLLITVKVPPEHMYLVKKKDVF